MSGLRKVLMLHGFVQSDKIFRQKTGGLRKSLAKMGYELWYPCGPELVDKRSLVSDDKAEVDKDAEGEPVYGWWIKSGTPTTGQQYTVPDATIKYLHDYVVENGPFEGVIGFSQGAALAGYLSTGINAILGLTPEEQPPLQFLVSFSGFRLEPAAYQQSYDTNSEWVPSLHVQGGLDAVVSEERVRRLYDTWPEDKRTLLIHPGSHFVPNSKQFVTKVCNWLTHVQKITKPPGGKETGTPRGGTIQDDTKPAALDDDLLQMMDSFGGI
ncbi:alpha/beta hydrolase KNAG_0G02920 [Huiozyma naganishii CBS 8797]|uniref:Serine hydrolase domain-containing protein n=1 Tax=Huiozyma naganishii (strain ATCC MYA-139 / BCRC 22969 / CBS 8797 / KCTC 17520 / NBRC 10181 / NCYC 3082 / Yp74L-3) TaxID=1071383 RepID=J7S849_HUIN7|nr:hypothetical protein KNAG_0G02920 [Kazachstania naganishii CBS 8797]CCK71349.1 hypothetical protein KNAG_0G02920 [Kazachstania naganishii CBS 8797]